jgi:hypothetical protein
MTKLSDTQAVILGAASQRDDGAVLPLPESLKIRGGAVDKVLGSLNATCAVTSVPAADVEGAVLDHVQKLLAAPELVARTWAAAKREGDDEITEREVTILFADFAAVWSELFPAERARIVQLLVERVDVQENALEVRVRAEGLASLVGELRQQGERRAA